MGRVQLQGPDGRAYREIDNWLNLPNDWTVCDVPGVTTGPDDRVYIINRGNCPRSSDHPIIVVSNTVWHPPVNDSWVEGFSPVEPEVTPVPPSGRL